ncbi:MAG TPA: hypothetical protein VE944_26035 [Nostoc sp.]|uniref:hypothetical protein n=1 Tax=Nostoc sp. TaxID=1180 RepID=UPI002D6652B9|nr:hypothetical protein [Nostoc sp.]HYX17754.1 hypothetical protein [Nostoc sp.]
MIKSPSTTWLSCAALTLLGFAADVPKAIAQTIYPFEAVYNVEITNIPIAPNIFESTDVGKSIDAPYGLTNLTNLTYAEFDPATSVFRFSSDPAALNLEGLPVSTFSLFSSGSDRVFGSIVGTASLDFENFVGTGSSTITITGGEGRFIGATGILNLLESDTFTPDPTAPINSKFTISGSFQTPQAVPEPETNATLIGIGAVSVGFLLSRRNNKAAA